MTDGLTYLALTFYSQHLTLHQEEVAALGEFLAAYISGGLAAHPLDPLAAASSLEPSTGMVSDAGNAIINNLPPSSV